jgi:hypothetical protein
MCLYILHQFGLEISRYSKRLDKWDVLLVGDTIVFSHPFSSSPNDPSTVKPTLQYFAGIFNPYIVTITILFGPI